MKANSTCLRRHREARHCMKTGNEPDVRRCWHKHRGAALPVVLLLTSAMLATSIASLDASIAAVRRAANIDDHLRAANAADAALSLCVRALDAGVAPIRASATAEPGEWRQPGVFDGPAAFAPLPQWPGSARPPQCVIESGRLSRRPHAQVYWVTARGFGADATAEAWLQVVIVRERGSEQRRWRRIVERSS
jgi:Tfp pilus assembly protein PilX